MTPVRTISLVCAVLLATGCLSSWYASPDLDTAAKTFTPPQREANVYIARDTGWPASRCEVSIDGRVVGWIGPSTFELVSLAPGTHVARCVMFDHTAQVSFPAEAGANYYFRVFASPGWNVPTVELQRCDEESGKALVTQGRRAATAIP